MRREGICRCDSSSGAPKLSGVQLRTVRLWLDCGAWGPKFGRQDVTRSCGTFVSLALASGDCRDLSKGWIRLHIKSHSLENRYAQRTQCILAKIGVSIQCGHRLINKAPSVSTNYYSLNAPPFSVIGIGIGSWSYEQGTKKEKKLSHRRWVFIRRLNKR